MKSTERCMYKYFAIVLIAVLLLIRIYFLNGSFKVNYYYPRKIYNYNESVDVGNNKYADCKTHEGWNFQIMSSEIYELNDFCREYKIDDSDILDDKKILEVNIRLTNTSNKINSIGINFFQVLGVDWYQTLDFELTHRINELFYENCHEENMGISLYPNDSYDIKLIYDLNEWSFSKKKYKNIDKEKMYFEITIMPENKLIYFR